MSGPPGLPGSRLARPGIRRVVVVVPSLFTLFNLFFGFWAMVLTARGEYYRAGWFIVFAGILDLLDGRVARLSGAGTRFGAELDSLVDIVSFGVAPAFLLHQVAFTSLGQMAWVISYLYVMAAALRLARFNVTQAGRPKSAFIGLPSPAAGMTLATYYPFVQSDLYPAVQGLPWQLLLIFLVISLAILMVSNVHYAQLPRAGLRTLRGLLGLAIILSIAVFGIWRHDEFFFPLGIAYMAYGVLRAVLLGFVEPRGREDAGIAGSIVVSDDADRVDEAYGRRRRGISPRGGAP
ncbi:MAG TPA: CDP-diacylglycerol--serine O-phosphatidyltransferase [Gemmatimonadales bacterium]|nr:CDP-diacylglycerol--serine O-phosphatidyltransferase [Gemmatimonadales bacterium]